MATKNEGLPEMKRRRWSAISLRTAFLLLTILCIWLGVVVSAARRQERTVQKIENHGGYVQYDYEWDSTVRQQLDWQDTGGVGPAPEPAGPRWLRNLIGKHYFCDVVYVFLRDAPEVDDELVADIGHFSELHYLELINCPKVTDAGIEQLPVTLPLISLDVEGTAISDNGVSHVSRFKKLEQLYIRRTNATAKCSRFIQDIEHLDRIGIEEDDMPDVEVEELRKSIPSLRVVR